MGTQFCVLCLVGCREVGVGRGITNGVQTGCWLSDGQAVAQGLFLSCLVAGVDWQPLAHGDLFPGATPTPCSLGPPHEWPVLLSSSTLHHPNLLLLMALSSLADLLGLCLLFEPVWLGSLHVVLQPLETE